LKDYEDIVASDDEALSAKIKENVKKGFLANFEKQVTVGSFTAEADLEDLVSQAVVNLAILEYRDDIKCTKEKLVADVTDIIQVRN
jgi:hypothetical protein